MHIVLLLIVNIPAMGEQYSKPSLILINWGVRINESKDALKTKELRNDENK
jgi:hypothetical protein